jgi:predicted phage terminase large subunit-like protein
MSRLELRNRLEELARDDFGVFVRLFSPFSNGCELDDNWHINVLCRSAEKVASGEERRLICTIPPRYLKSYIFSICLPAWLLGRKPKSKILCVSYAATLAEKFSSDTLKLMESSRYRRIFRNTMVDKRKHSAVEFATTAGGFRLATSVGGTLTGRGGDLIIVDDPLKAGEAHSPTARESCISWFNTSVHSRLNNPKTGRIVVVGQRLHAEDLPGHLQQAGGWQEIMIPAIAWDNRTYDMGAGLRPGRCSAGRVLQPERQSRKELEQLRRTMGEHDFEAQYNQRPLPPGGATFKAEWLKRYHRPPPKAAVRHVYQSWDTAYETSENNDYSVCTTWADCGGNFYLLDVYRQRLKFWELEREVYELKRIWHADMVIVEKAGSGISLYQNIRLRDRNPWLCSYTAEKAKQVRAEQQSPKVQQGRVFLPEKAEWLAAFENELLAFPYGKHDDQVDSLTQFLTIMDLPGISRRAESCRYG